MFYYLIITLGAGGCRKRLSLVRREGSHEISQGGGRDTRRNHCSAPIIHTSLVISTVRSRVHIISKIDIGRQLHGVNRALLKIVSLSFELSVIFLNVGIYCTKYFLKYRTEEKSVKSLKIN